MQEKQRHPPEPERERQDHKADPAMQGRKPGRSGKAQVAPEKAPKHGETVRREFGRDG